jgi:outer membrane protein assembly factor BamB
LSDNRFNDPNQPYDGNPRRDSWEQEPYTPYEDPFINPEGTGAPLTNGRSRNAFSLQGDPYGPPVDAPPQEPPVFTAPQQVNKRTTAVPAPDDAREAPRRMGRVARFHEGEPSPQADTRPAPRRAEPNGQYAGPRTARPQEVAAGMRPPVRADGAAGPRPQAQPVRQRPPVSRQRDEAYGWPQPSDQPPMYEPYDNRKPPGRRGRGIFILLIVLIVLGGAFAGIWLPNWDSVNGTVGEAMSSVQKTLKDLIIPEEIVIRAFSVQPETGVTGIEFSFVIQASAATETVRIIDDGGKTILEKTLTDQDRLLGTVTKNSDGNNIWKLRYTFDTAYTGNLTAQALTRDGTWDTENAPRQAVSIEPPIVFDPPVQDFLCSTVSDVVPVNISFSVVTSLGVSAVRVVNDYGDEIAKLTINSAGMNMTETEDNRVWTLEGLISEPYTGSLYVGYELIVGEGFTQSDFKEDVEYMPAAVPEDTLPPEATVTPAGITQPTAPPVITPTAEPTATPTASPTPEPTATPTASPSPTPEPEPTPTPSPTLMPLLDVQADTSADSGVISLNTAAYDGTTKTGSYSRTELINLLDSQKYAIWDQSGVLTFRGGPLRQNAAYGTVEIETGKMSVLWKVPVEGSKKMNGVTLTGVGWPGQAAIVKWPMEVRQLMGVFTELKDKAALKEVIVGAQTGMLYFMDLSTGEYTRDPIELSWPPNGSVSVNTDGSPLATFGQFYSIKVDKTKMDNGLHIFNLINNKELALLNGRTKPIQTNYSGFSGAPLFDKNSGAMIVGGQNGVLYLGDFNTKFDYTGGTLEVSPKYHRYTWTAAGQDAKETNIDGSVAMYGPYAYFGDAKGIVQCVDVNTLKSMWAARIGDMIEGTVALDMNAAGDEVALYVGNVVKNQGKGGTASFFRFDALTGKKIWQFDLTGLTYTTAAPTGIYASPIVGQNNVSDMVFFTVANGETDSTLYALSKADGSVQWSTTFDEPTESSPVAVYNDAGDAWIVQALSDGRLMLVDADDGAVLSTLQLEGEVEASPAVYRDILVISTTGEDPSYIYAITLE